LARELAALKFARICIPVDINLPNLSATQSTDFRIAPVKVRPAGIDDASIVVNVGAIECIDDDGDVARTLVDATASPVRVGTKITYINEGVIIGADVAGAIDPRADPNIELA
jgi:hypothetical protein